MRGQRFVLSIIYVLLKRNSFDVRAIIQKSDISLIVSVILGYQNEIWQEVCDVYFLLEDHQLFLVTFKANCINEGRFGVIT